MTEPRHWIRLTRRCNQRCVFCLDRKNQDDTVVSLPEVLAELRRGRGAGACRAVLSGGEPTLHPDFAEIVARARSLGYRGAQVITNGRRMCYPPFARRAAAAGLTEATFSIHGDSPELHDGLTRAPGSFIQALAGLRNALEAGLIVNVDVVLTRRNLPRLKEILEFFIRRGVWEFDLLALIPFGDAWANWGELACDFGREPERGWLRRALELSRDPRLHIWTNRLRPRYLEGFELLIQPPEKILDEVRGRKTAFEACWTEGRKPPCAGERCRHCFLQEFCEDLGAFQQEGKLEARPIPACLDGEPGARAGRVPAASRKGGLEDFAAFFIRHRYYARGAKCAECLLSAGCAGMPVRRLRHDCAAVR